MAKTEPEMTQADVNAETHGALMALQEAVAAIIATHPDREKVVHAMDAYGEISQSLLLHGYGARPNKVHRMRQVQSAYQAARNALFARPPGN